MYNHLLTTSLFLTVAYEELLDDHKIEGDCFSRLLYVSVSKAGRQGCDILF